MTARGVLAVLAVLAAAGLLLGYDPVLDVDPALAGAPPRPGLWLGGDPLGRDVLARVVVAAGGLVGPALGAVGLALVLGVPLGAVRALAPRGLSLGAGALLDAVGVLPQIVLALVACVVAGGDPLVVGLACGLGQAPLVGDAAAAALRRLRATGVLEASRVHGVPLLRVVFVHGLWGGARRALAHQAVVLVSRVATLEATLSYLGRFGVSEPAPSWGNMVDLSLGHPNGQALAWLGPAVALWALSWAATRAVEAPDAR